MLLNRAKRGLSQSAKDYVCVWLQLSLSLIESGTNQSFCANRIGDRPRAGTQRLQRKWHHARWQRASAFPRELIARAWSLEIRQNDGPPGTCNHATIGNNEGGLRFGDLGWCSFWKLLKSGRGPPGRRNRRKRRKRKRERRKEKVLINREERVHGNDSSSGSSGFQLLLASLADNVFRVGGGGRKEK
jgi:hypothetical protein